LFTRSLAQREPPRAGEIDGEDYHFLSEPDFRTRIAAGEFLEHANVHGRYVRDLAGSDCEQSAQGIDVLIDIDTQGAAAIRQYDDAFVRQALADVFIMPPDLEELRRRLTKRARKRRRKSRRAANRRPRNGALARLSLHDYQSFGGGGLAEVSPHHGCGALPEQPDGFGLTMKKKKQTLFSA
jgi:guanylate kinase